jgi:hypothetical protein
MRSTRTVRSAAGDDSGPTHFAGSLCVGRENPLANGVMGGVERVVERLSGDLGGLGPVYAGGTHLGGDTGFQALESLSGCVPIGCCSQAGQLFQERMDGGAECAGEQTAFVAAECEVPTLSAERRGKDGARSISARSDDSDAACEEASLCAGWKSGGRRRSGVGLAGLGITMDRLLSPEAAMDSISWAWLACEAALAAFQSSKRARTSSSSAGQAVASRLFGGFDQG